jgi:ribonuclease BN (tRNA processing enzyme)
MYAVAGLRIPTMRTRSCVVFLAATFLASLSQAADPPQGGPPVSTGSGLTTRSGGRITLPQAGRGTQGTKSAASRTQLVLLGTGTPNPDPDRSGPSLAVVVDDVPYLVDFGPGVVRRAAAAFKQGVKGLDVKLLRTAFATHLHSDHTAGYPDLIFTPAVLERDATLQMYGPPGLQVMTDHVLQAWAADLDIRLKDIEPAKPVGYKVEVHEIAEPGIVFKDPRVTVRAFRVRHGAWPVAYGYRFETPDRSIVVSGDTGPDSPAADACDGCDILVHEVYSTAGFATRPPEWQRYHRVYHTSSSELSAIATRARPGLLVLTHQLFWGTTDEALVAEVRRGYAGKVVSGRDLDVF